MTLDDLIIPDGGGRSFPFLGGTMTIKEDGSNARGELTVMEVRLPPNTAAPPQHLHHKHEETWYVLEGELEFTVGEESARVGAGAWVLVPIGVPHTFRNPSDQPARFLCTMTPGFYLGYFEELSARIDELFAVGQPPDGPTLGRLTAELMPKYHTELA
jgi:mannose-6-phosphate isomerase-like protein (cupin superfamily)